MEKRKELGVSVHANHDDFHEEAEKEEDMYYHKVLRNIKLIWLSHPHADHHLGIIRLLSDRHFAIQRHIYDSSKMNSSNGGGNIDASEYHRQQGDRDPVIIVAPPPLFRFLEEYSRVCIDPYIRKSYHAIECKAIQEQLFLPQGYSNQNQRNNNHTNNNGFMQKK